MPQRVIDAWDYFYYKQKTKRNKKVKEKKMKKGDIVTLIIHGVGVTSEEEGYVIEDISDNILILEDEEKVFYNKKGRYRTECSEFGFWFEIKEI